MNRRLSRGLQAPLFLIIVIALVSFNGCGGGGSGPDPIVGSKNFGPPFYEIVFHSSKDFIATASTNVGLNETFVPNIGQNLDLSSPGLGVLYKKNLASQNPNLLVYDKSSLNLYVVDSLGTLVYDYENIYDNFYDATESRIGRVKVVGSSTYTLESSAWESVLPTYEFATVSSPEMFASRPSFNGGATRLMIAIQNSDDASLNRIVICGAYFTEHYTEYISGLAPQFSPVSDDSIAYIESTNGPENATNLVLVDGQLDDELTRYNFSQYGTGATSFSWSPDGEYIAMYAGIYGPEPKLVLVNIAGGYLNELSLGEYTISLGTDEDLYWAFPEWNDTGTKLVVPAMTEVNGSMEYHIVVYNLSDFTAVSISDLGTASTHPHWRKYRH